MSDVAARPVLPGDRVNDVLARDEALVDVFVRHSPHFTKLRNRAMRRIMGRLVTVEDASRMAAVPLDSLLRDLNEALGMPTLSAGASTSEAAWAAAAPASSAAPGSHPLEAAVVEVDVRDDLRSGREPLARIMAAVSALHDGEVLRVRAIFEPVPLFTLLAKRGYLHESTCHAPDDWSVWFWRSGVTDPDSPPSASLAPVEVPAGEIGVSAGDRTTVLLDVRGLQPPEPLVRTLAALESLPDGHQLVQVNSRVPQLLLPMLAERGFACALDESHADRVLLRIWRPA